MDVVEFIEEFGSWKKIVPPITNSNFKEYYVLVSPYSHIAMKLEARGDEKLQTLTCTDLYKKLAKILIKKYDLDVYTESEHYGYETKLISKDLNINISCVTHNIGGDIYKVSRIIYILQNEKLNSMFNKEIDDYLKEVEQNQLNEIDQNGL